MCCWHWNLNSHRPTRKHKPKLNALPKMPTVIVLHVKVRYSSVPLRVHGNGNCCRAKHSRESQVFQIRTCPPRDRTIGRHSLLCATERPPDAPAMHAKPERRASSGAWPTRREASKAVAHQCARFDPPGSFRISRVGTTKPLEFKVAIMTTRHQSRM